MWVGADGIVVGRRGDWKGVLGSGGDLRTDVVVWGLKIVEESKTTPPRHPAFTKTTV